MKAKKNVKRFTAKWIEKLPLTKEGQDDYYDSLPPLSGHPGQLGVRVGKKFKSWFVRCWVGKSQYRKTIGRYPRLPLKDARAVAAERLKEVQSGGNDLLGRRCKNKTLNDAWEAYIKKLTNRSVKVSKGYKDLEINIYNSNLKDQFGHIPLTDVTKTFIDNILERKAEKTPMAANSLYGVLNRILKFAKAREWIKSNPLDGLDKPGGPSRVRARYLKDEELARVWENLDLLSHNHCDIFKLLLYTAQRVGEVRSMEKDHVDFEKRIWEMPSHKVKNGREHIVPLSDQVIDILKKRLDPESYSPNALWKLESKYFFPTTRGRSGHTVDINRSRKKLQEASEVCGWVTHDLRRTGRTLMSKLKVINEHAEAVLNHAKSDLVGTYNKYEYLDEKREALQKLANEIDRIVGNELPEGAQGSNVISIGSFSVKKGKRTPKKIKVRFQMRKQSNG